MQIAVIEFARNVLGIANANSYEFDSEVKDPVVWPMPEHYGQINIGGTMRLGSQPCVLRPDTLAANAYDAGTVNERHRHRMEFNNVYRDTMQHNGVVFSGLSPDGQLVEIVELRDHPWFVGVQFHPEFRSRPFRPHPLFTGFAEACVRHETALLEESAVRQESRAS
jgi:CTP synthase